MYTLEQLRDKTFKELKGIGWELNVLPAGDRRCRQNWIDAIAGVNPPLLALLEVSPGVEVESVADAHEVQATEPIAIQALVSFQIGDLVESIHERWGLEEESLTGTVIFVHPSGGVRVNFGAGGTFDYSRPGKDLIKTSIKIQVQEPIALAVETSPGVSFDIEEFQQTHEAEIESYFKSFTEADRPPNRGDNGRGRIESEPKLTQSAMAFRPRPCYGRDDSQAVTGITFSPRFLAAYPPYFGDIRYKSEATGQLNLLEPETTEEPPDPDDYEGDMFAFWAVHIHRTCCHQLHRCRLTSAAWNQRPKLPFLRGSRGSIPTRPPIKQDVT